MELRHLRYLVGLADDLHFGRAAQKLGISQPPLSQQIRALEDEIGIILFDRTSRRVRLTDAGVIFVAEARRTLDQVQHLLDVARRIREGEEGELAIGFSTSVPFVPVFAAALARFRAEHPAIHLTLAELSPQAQIAQIGEGALDLAFVRSFDRPVPPDGLAVSLLIEEPLLIALRDDHPLAALGRPLAIDDLVDQPFVVFTREAGRGFNEHLATLMARAGHRLNVVQEVSGFGTMLSLVGAALGITVISNSLSALNTGRVVYRPLEAEDAVSRLWLVRGHSPSLIARSFVAMLAAPTR